ncbi:MAG: hypothetical protein CMJ64_01505 [Planctomycetaceae bacterium]|nr:hypothetical protein [Planctomycetaceae bacterium]
MRLLHVVLLGFGLLALTSCSRTQEQQLRSQAADDRPLANQPDLHEPSGVHSSGHVHAEHDHTDGHPQNAHEAGGHQGPTDADHHGSPLVATSSHERHGESHGRSEPQHRDHAGHNGHQHSGEQHAGEESKHIAIGDKVPDFEVTINGKSLKLSDLQDNGSLTEDGTLVLTFWCSFCHSCRHVEHRLDELAKQYKGKVGVIALDASAGETTDGVAKFVKKNKLTMPIALDADGTAADIFGVRVTTTTVVIDGNGVLRYCGQFGDDQHAFATDALKAVLAGEDVRLEKTGHKG